MKNETPLTTEHEWFYPTRVERWFRERDEELDIEADAAEFSDETAPDVCCPHCGGGLRLVRA